MGKVGLSQDFRVIGKSLIKVDAAAKCSGRTIFADDIHLPGMLYARLARSSRAHARIVSVDTSKAERIPGVVRVLLGSSLSTPFGILPVSQDELALATDRVRHVGDPIAAVAAVDEESAEEAVRLIEVDYDDLESIMSIEQALEAGTPPIHDYADDGNIHKAVALEFGDVAQALERSDLVEEGTYFYGGSTHLPIEQHCAVGQMEADGKLTVWSSTQTPHYVHRALARVLEMPASRIRVIACPNGGGFGGKSDPFSHEIVAAKLALLTGRPVKITLTREEVFYCHRGRHPVLMNSRIGFDREGKITGLHFRSILDGGGYGSYGVASTFYTGALQTVTYKVPRYRFDGARVFTNKPPCGPKRGHGTPQPRFALEIQIDKAAERLGIDPADLRLRNLVEPDSLTANWLQIRSCALEACLHKVLEGSSWSSRFRQLPRGQGLGLACSAYLTGAGLPIYRNDMPHSAVYLTLDRSGSATVLCGSVDIGQGSDSMLVWMVAEILGIDPLDIHLKTADTAYTPVDLGSYSSRVTLMTGNAAVEAASQARERLARAVGEKLAIPHDRLVFADGAVSDRENPGRKVSFAEAVCLAEAGSGPVFASGSYSPPRSPGRFKGAGVGPTPTYSYTACVAQVRVDEETGIVSVERIWIAHDVGRAINPMLVIGQIEGGVYMGLGEALMEEHEFRLGAHKAPSMLDYKSPTAMDMCRVETFLVEEPDEEGPFGAKEAGQGPLLPVPPAVVNAIYDAVGVRIDEIPVSPEKVRAALKNAEEGKEPRYGPTAFPKVPYPTPRQILPPWEGGDGRERAVEAWSGGKSHE